MADLRYFLYDTAVFGTTAGTEHVLFQVAQGGDATHTEDFTNSRGAGSLPSEERFVCDRIGVFVDAAIADAEVEKVFTGSFLEIRVADKSVFKAPLKVCAGYGGWSGHFTQATAANRALIGPAQGYCHLDIPIEIPGGTAFRVRVYQKTALAAAANVKVVLGGVLSTP